MDRVGCPLYPGGDGVHTVVDESSTAVRRFHGQPLFVPGITTRPGGLPSRGINEGSFAFTQSALPLTCDTQSERVPLGFSLSFAPSHYWPRTSGRGPVSNTDQDLRLGHVPDLQSTYSLNTCDLVSQRSSTEEGMLLRGMRVRSVHWYR